MYFVYHYIWGPVDILDILCVLLKFWHFLNVLVENITWSDAKRGVSRIFTSLLLSFALSAFPPPTFLFPFGIAPLPSSDPPQPLICLWLKAPRTFVIASCNDIMVHTRIMAVMRWQLKARCLPKQLKMLLSSWRVFWSGRLSVWAKLQCHRRANQ